MAVELSIITISSFLVTSLLLVVYSWMDFKTRRVPNRVMLAGQILGIVTILVTGHLVNKLPLHVVSAVFVSVIAYVLFRLKSIGGADWKSLLTIAIISPGIEFTTWENPIYEAIIGAGLEMGIMLLLGYAIWKVSTKEEGATRTTPLVPFLLVAYLMVQLLALI